MNRIFSVLAAASLLSACDLVEGVARIGHAFNEITSRKKARRGKHTEDAVHCVFLQVGSVPTRVGRARGAL
ncbi:MAG: hypothetical protein AAGA48_09865, partial [Myxococcota bacterium]